jgi:hypothetical protein
MKLTEAQLELLKKPLPKEAVTPHPTKSYLSNIKAIYVVERLNDVFGLGGWQTKNKVIEAGTDMIVVKSIFTAPEYEITIESYGGNDNKDRGDAYKGACTDALTKIGSYLGIGMDVFKGLTDGGISHKDYEADKKTGEIKPKYCSICGLEMILSKAGKFYCKEEYGVHRGKKGKPMEKKPEVIEEEINIEEEPF